MAGSPKKRAARLAAAGRSPALPPTPTDWEAAAAMQLMGGAPAPAVSRLGNMIDIQHDDRAALITWWRDQMEHMEADHAARVELLRTAGEHPSPLFGRQVMEFGALGMPKDVAAKLVGITEGQLDSYYADEYEIGSAQILGQVAANLARIATSMNDRVAVKAAVEIMNRRGGEPWRPPAQKIEVADDRTKNKGVIDSSKLSYEDRKILRLVVERALNPALTSGVAGGESDESVIESGE